ncbi:MAG: tRNA lysidine(34) synthetase TilS [Alphaproteobacteria bacterium]|nr:tRNA lysidine(34) synthetase TilS [Alphaproteobacteria bacterium]
MNKKFINFMNAYRGQKLAVAVSGGVDSVCLLVWLAKIGADIVALHVNHGLRPAGDTETQYVQKLCQEMGIPCHTFYWRGPKPTRGLESAARDARYKFMTDFCHKNNIDALMVAHQSDDQIETFLMNLGRGSGVYGLAAMRAISFRDGVKIVRPLLGVSRAELRQYCDDNSIRYFFDEMNDDTHYTRVRIRKNRHVLAEELGISDARILLAIENLGRVRDFMDGEIERMACSVMCRDRRGTFAMFSDSFLFDPGDDIRLKLLGTLIVRIGGDTYPPRLASLKRGAEQLRGDVKFTLGHCTVRRLGSRIIIVREGELTSFRKKYERHEKKEKSVQA